MTADARPGRSSRLVLLAFAAALLLFTKDHAGSWADGSRLGTIQALVEHGTLALDDTAFYWQGDKVRLGEHDYSHQPPMLALLGALVYAPLHAAGLAITDPWTYRLLTWALVGLPLWLGMAALARLLAASGCGERWSAVLLALAAFGTLALPYGLVLNQHGTAAGLVLVAWLALARGRVGSAAVLLSLASTIDMTALVPALAGALPVLAAGGAPALARYVAFALPPAAVFAGVNWRLVGDLLPVAMHHEAFEYPLSPFMLMALTGDGHADRPGEAWAYARDALFGQSGLFSHHPALLLALAAAAALPLARRRAPDGDEPPPAGLAPSLLLAAALASLGIVALYLATSRNFGGSAFGMRWFTVFSPLLALFPAAWLARRASGWRAGPLLRTAVAVTGAWSVLAACLGAVQPWMKFSYLPRQRPEARVAAPGTEPPALVDHWRTEWHRVTTWRQPFDRAYYESWFGSILHLHGRLHLERFPELSADEQAAWTRRGLDRLQPVVDLLDTARLRTPARVYGHYWLGRFHERLGRRREALTELEACLDLDPGYEPARAARERLLAE